MGIGGEMRRGQWSRARRFVLKKGLGALRMSDNISVFLVSQPVHTDRPFVDPKELPNQAERHGGMMLIAQDSACAEALLSNGWARVEGIAGEKD
jgi:hypothetical protein